MSFRALVYAYVLGGLTLLPLVVVALVYFAIYTSVPVGDPDSHKAKRGELEEDATESIPLVAAGAGDRDVNDLPPVRKAWMTMRRTFEEEESDGGYVGYVRGLLDARSRDPKRARPRDMWFAVLKGSVLFLFEDEEMTECEAALQLGAHDVLVFPEHQPEAELFAKRNALCLRPRAPPPTDKLPSVTREMRLRDDRKEAEGRVDEKGTGSAKKQRERERIADGAKQRDAAREQAADPRTPWFIFCRSNVEMEDWYHALLHASKHPANSSTLAPLEPVFLSSDMDHLVGSLDEQPDVIPTRWLNALIGRLFFSFYRTQHLESFIIARLMKKLDKVKRPQFLTDIVVTQVSVGDRPPTFSKPMLKELTKEGDASVEVHLHYKGEFRITIETTATINLGARFKSYTVKLALAAILREIEGNLLVKVKRPPSNRIWYGFTQTPRMVLAVEPIVSDRQITWSMITSTIESKMKEIILESIVLPNMDDIAFFNSANYENRGGIWADACRQERQEAGTTTAEEPASTSAPAQSAPDLLGASSAPGGDALDESDPVSPPAGGITRMSSAPPEIIAPLSTASKPPTTTPLKRRTWFSGPQELQGLDSASEFMSNQEDVRGRPTEVEPALGPRSQSTPIPPRPEDSSPPAEPSGPPLLPPHRRPSSRSSGAFAADDAEERTPQATEFGAGSDAESFNDAPSRNASRSAPSTPSLSRSTSGTSSRASGSAGGSGSRSTSGSGPITAANLFSTIKARAAATDTQALGTQAKEAMRKWGAAWGRRRRDSGGESDNADAADTDGAGAEHERDSLATGRPNFSELRAKVEERRATRGDPLPSAPVPIPGRERTLSTASRPSTPGSVSASPNVGLAVPAPAPPVRAPSPPGAPLYTQPPRPKTMSIPGIHASHKGDVMSLGYTPPAPAPAAPALGESVGARVPTAVYSRLWKKSAGASGAEGAKAAAAGAAPSMAPPSPEAPGDGAVAPTATSAAPPSSSPTTPHAPAPGVTPSSPVPPPLPPRKVSVTASEALQRIAVRDEDRRTGTPLPAPAEENPQESPATAGAPPPLPPRKSKTIAP